MTNHNQKHLGKRPIVCSDFESLPQSAHSRSPPNKTNPTTTPKKTTNYHDHEPNTNLTRELNFDGEGHQEAHTDHSDTSTFDRVAAKFEESLRQVKMLLDAHDKLVGVDDELFPALRLDASKKRAYVDKAFTPTKKPSTSMKSAANPTNTPQIIIVTVKSDDEADVGVEFPMTPTTPFARVYREYGYLINADTEDFVIKKGLRVIDEYKTPEQAMVRHGDILIADPMYPSLNTNTHKRTIIFHQTKDGPGKELKVTLPEETRIVELYRTWGDFIGYNTCTFDLVHNEYRVPRFGNLNTHGMRNGCHIYCVRLHPGVGSIGTPTELRST